MVAKYFICPTLKALISTDICENNKKKDPTLYNSIYTCSICKNSEYFQLVTYTLQEVISGSHSERVLQLEVNI